MVFDLNLYRIHFEGLKASLKPRDEKVRLYWASYYAATSGCPIIAILHYTAEIYGMSEAIEDNLKTVMPLYSIDEVVGVKNDNI